MNFAVPARLSAGVLGLTGGALAIVMGFVLVLFGGVVGALASSSGGSLALSGGLAMVFGILAAVSALLFFLPSHKPAVICAAVSIAGLIWAFARVDAWGLALVPVAPLAASVLLGLAGAAAPRSPSAS